MRRSLLIALPLLVLLAGARPAQGYNVGGARWPGSTPRITYYESTPASYHWSIGQAAVAWNTSGVRVRFVRVSRRSSARVVIQRAGSLPSGFGFASIGYQPSSYIQLNMGTTDKWTFAGVVAHEMGHILGLGHVSHGCAAMSPLVYMNCRPEWPRDPWQWRCRMLQRDDLAGAQRLYGGKARLRHSMFCDKEPKTPSVSSIVVTQLRSSPLRISQVTIKLPARVVREVDVLRRAGRCPTGPNDPHAQYVGRATGKPRTTVSLYDDSPISLPAGAYCYRAWTYDEWDRAGGTRSAQLNYTGPPPVPVANVTAVSQNTLIHPGVDQDPVYVDITVTTPTLSWVPGADVVMKQGGCPAGPQDGTSLGSVPPGAGKHVLYGAQIPAAGSWCVAAFAIDSSNRHARAGATVTFVYVPPAAPAPTGGSASLVGGDVQVSWNWPAPAPSYAVIARFDGKCPGTITRQDIDNAPVPEYVDGAGTATWTDYTPSTGTYCAALYDYDQWGYVSSVLEIEYTVP